jgi:hypothetical protein
MALVCKQTKPTERPPLLAKLVFGSHEHDYTSLFNAELNDQKAIKQSYRHVI